MVKVEHSRAGAGAKLLRNPPIRRRILAAAVALIAFVPAGARAQAVRDPHLEWRTIRTPHFEIHYHEPLGMIARRVASVAERAHSVLVPRLDHHPTERTQIVLTDDSDDANGSAGATPYNHIRLFASGPEDLTPLADYDDWLTELVTHEHTHVLHLDTVSGIPAIINAILGKVYPPNSVQPRWFVEGLAVHEESAHTSGGRLRSSMFDMFLRMDALQDRLLSLAQISNEVDRWPHGNVYYLYGSRFVEYISEEHGPEALTTMSHEYGRQLVPYGLNRVARRATGRTFVELYDDFLEHTRDEARARADEVRARGLIEGRRITFHGETARCPRFVDDERLAYFVGADEPSHLRMVDAVNGENPEVLTRVTGVTCLSVSPDGRYVYYAGLDEQRDIYLFYDLFRYDRRTGRREKLTHGLRAREPDVSPDGRQLVFTVNGAATTHLMIADASDVEATRRVLVRSPRYGQVYTPRFSPDGRSVAFSAWDPGGYRDIRIVDVESGRVVDVTRDRALDTGPTWSPDGRLLYFSSDRTGIANIYAYDTVTGRTLQVTNVVGGAFQPAVSPDGSRMAYLGYSSWGWDLWTLPLEPASFRPAPAYVDTRPEPADTRETALLQSEEYDPLANLFLPQAFLLELGQDAFGTQLAVTFDGGDVVGFHRYAGRIGVGLERGNVDVALDYVYQHLPVAPRLHLFRATRPAGGLVVGGEARPWIEESMGASVGLDYSMPRSFHSEVLRVSYDVTLLDKAEPFGGRLDPNDPPPTIPETGLLASASAGWFWSDTVATAFDISPTSGRAIEIGLSLAHPYLGSRFETVSATWSITQYVENPFVEHHVLAVRYGGGLSGGDLRRRGVFFLGGFGEADIVQQLLLEASALGGVALRGYPPGSRQGTRLHLVQLEYRFPILRIMQGIETLPAYLSRLWGSVFLDYGDAFFGPLDLSTFRVGIGGELYLDFLLGYVLPYTLRIGVARGLSEGGTTNFHFHVGRPF